MILTSPKNHKLPMEMLSTGKPPEGGKQINNCEETFEKAVVSEVVLNDGHEKFDDHLNCSIN